MKRLLFFMTLLCVSITTFAQVEWIGIGDGYSWDDPLNWDIGDIPYDGDDILINGAAVNFGGSPFFYGSLELTGGANLLLQGDMFLYGDFTVDASSTLSIDLEHLNSFSKVILDGNYYFNGDADLLFSSYVPQIGNSYQIIQGLFGSCGTATTDIVPDYQTTGFEVYLGVQCQSEGVLYTVTDINYITAKAWDGEGGDSMWSNSANWDPNGVPTVNDKIIINLPTGGYVNTSGAGITSAYSILVGDNNTLAINGDLAMFSIIQVNDTGTILWNAGELSRTDTNVTSTIINYGNIVLDSPGLKEIENGFEIWNQGVMNLNQGNLNINNGEITNYNATQFNINGDNINIGYTSGTQHSLRNFGVSTIKKTAGDGTSSINLTNLLIDSGASVICQQGTLTFGENLTNYGNLGGSGNFQMPPTHVETGTIALGASPGILTFVGDLTTGVTADFNIEIDGPIVGVDYDQVVVTNAANIEGNLNVVLGYLPANDAEFEIIKAGTLGVCNLPETITADFGGNSIIFTVVCNNDSIYLTGPDSTLSNQGFSIQDVVLYPNPTSDYINVKMSIAIKGSWQLINQLGQLVVESNFEGNELEIIVKDVISGIYFLKITDLESNNTFTKKIIVSN